MTIQSAPVICTKRFGRFFVAWIDGDRWASATSGITERAAIRKLIASI